VRCGIRASLQGERNSVACLPVFLLNFDSDLIFPCFQGTVDVSTAACFARSSGFAAEAKRGMMGFFFFFCW
jgi:hypothetical protein